MEMIVCLVRADSIKVNDKQNNTLRKCRKKPNQNIFTDIKVPTITNKHISEIINEMSWNKNKYITIETTFEITILFRDTGVVYKIIALLSEKSPEIISLEIIIVENLNNNIEDIRNPFQ